ncbi:hypothetical protein HPB51_007020 [Rhipicephalus microplus]|uniref:Uncharacterized protein n=1 Tax=Rhipicephalus microplus TaxID=6941 RepID=A0A9J6D8Z4_RHIMP|nr:hypothetical protein HPB51_007020 [Rhipicephalus microplus]
MMGVIECLVVALLVARASSHKLLDLKHHFQPTVHAVPAIVHTTISHRPFVLPAPLVAPRPLVQPVLVQPRPLPPPIHSTVVIQTAPRAPPPPPPSPVLVQPVVQPRLVAPQQVLVPTRVVPPAAVVTHHHHPFFVSGLVAAQPPRSLLVHAPPPAALPAVAAPPPPPPPPAVQPLFVVPEPKPTVTTVPLQPRLVHQAVEPTRAEELPPKVSYILHHHTRLVQVAPPPPPPPPPPSAPAVLPAAAPLPTALVQPVAAVAPLPVPARQVQVIREVIRPTYVIEHLSKKQRKFRKIKMLKNCSLLKKLKSQLASSAENLHLYDTHGPYEDDAHVDSYSHVHVPYSGGSANVEVYRSIHGSEFAKRNGR